MQGEVAFLTVLKVPSHGDTSSFMSQIHPDDIAFCRNGFIFRCKVQAARGELPNKC